MRSLDLYSLRLQHQCTLYIGMAMWQYTLGFLSKFPSRGKAFGVVAESGELKPRKGSPPQESTERNPGVTENRSQGNSRQQEKGQPLKKKSKYNRREERKIIQINIPSSKYLAASVCHILQSVSGQKRRKKEAQRFPVATVYYKV